MKHSITLILFFCTYLTSLGQTTLDRNDAGLRGDAGATSGFFQAVSPVNFPTVASSWWHLLDVRHTNGTNNYAMQFSGSFFDQDLYFRKTNNSASQTWSRVLLEVNGKVGIGTLTPAYDLDVTKFLRVGAQGGSDVALLGGGSGIGAQMKLFYHNGAENVRLTGNNDSWLNATIGNVGIGTTAPSEKLSIYGIVNTSPGILSLESHRNDVTYAEVGALKGKNGTVEVTRIGMLRGGETFSGVMNFFVKASNDSPLFEAMRIAENGNVGVGTMVPNEKFAVNGKIRAKEIKVEPNPATWPDYVFEEDYNITSLTDLEKYIRANKHLPEMPMAKEVAVNGVELGEMNRLLLKKIEELTLHLIEKDKEVQKLNVNFEHLAKDFAELKKLILKKND
ncbi:hypothetical protein [Pedobacter frigiditerrae]|uniref:hypothetical protein n=1 Tax=Pedobacter frigiditerrae TaxID=2530452 RepID=UPI00197DC013|nr:hypothetical protein [Pedobacter frigiditerrae]